MAGNYHYKRDSGGRHIQIDITAVNPGNFNVLAKDLMSMAKVLDPNGSALSEVTRVVSEDIADEAMKIVRQHGADRDFDGNRITNVLPYRAKGGRWGVKMTSGKKENSEFPDAYYIEYGYGYKALNKGGTQSVADAARESGRKGSLARRYSPGAIASNKYHGEHKRDLTDAFGSVRSGWFYYNQLNAGRKQFSRGRQGIAAMYRGRKATVAKLRDKSGSAYRKAIMAIGDALMGGR